MANYQEQRMQQAIERLTRKKTDFSPYHSMMNWYNNADPLKVQSEIRYVDFLFQGIIYKYSIRNIYLTIDAIQDIVFAGITTQSSKTFEAFVNSQIRKRGLTKDAIVIFPIHSFGIRTKNFLTSAFKNKSPYISFDNIRILSQTNDFEKSQSQIRKYLDSINYPYMHTFEDDLIRHFKDTRDLEWLTSNHLLIFKFKFAQIYTHDSISVIFRKLDSITTKLYFFSVFYEKLSKTKLPWSTLTGNNWETLDISHFLTITTLNKKIEIKCIPFIENISLVFEKTFMNINLPEFHSMNSPRKSISRALDKLFAGIEDSAVHQNSHNAKFSRLSRSLSFFRKSNKATTMEDKILFINTAFECLLLDQNEREKGKKMRRRIWKVLSATTMKRANFSKMIIQRNNIIHNGMSADKNIDINDIYYTYCKLILFLEKQIKAIQSNQQNYLGAFYDNL